MAAIATPWDDRNPIANASWPREAPIEFAFRAAVRPDPIERAMAKASGQDPHPAWRRTDVITQTMGSGSFVAPGIYLHQLRLESGVMTTDGERNAPV